jgi:Fe-S cluster assembly ATP-binding protein
VITHYPKILTYLKPTFVHIFKDGKIITTGNTELVQKLEEEGYDSFS